MLLVITSPINSSDPRLIGAPRLSSTTKTITTSSQPSMQVCIASHYALIPPTIRNLVNQPVELDPTDPPVQTRAYNHSSGWWIKGIVLTSCCI